MSPRRIWVVVSSVFVALVIAAPTSVQPAAAAPTALMSPASVAATVGVVVSDDSTYNSSIVLSPLSLAVTPASQAGMTLETVTASTVHLSGTPTQAGTFAFQVAGSDETTTDTATLQVVVVCPNPIDVDSSTAGECLPIKASVALGDQGASPTDTFTAISPHAGDPHIAYNTQADGCAACHRTHADQSQTFVTQNTVSHSVECLACHDGTGANTDVYAEYSDTATSGGVNVPATRSYYTHDALAVGTGHVAASSDDEGGSLASNEFQGVANRHSDCVDCHNPHATALSPAAVQRVDAGTASGWLLSGALQSASVADVQVDSATAFVGHASTAANYEYQLCMKCHSSFTVLGANDPLRPSRDWLDKALEVDTDVSVNKSFHPITRRGTNQTDTMTASLTGTSASKVWKFATTDTVRCANCHASGASAGGPGQPLAPHASANRGILIAQYRDRSLVPADDTATVAWKTERFALCFTCHTDVPFVNNTSSGTAFRYHYEHTQTIAHIGGPGGNSGLIDEAGAGNGTALCAECHFRLHSTRNAVGTQTIAGSRLVNFAPNVEAVSGVLRWTPRSGATPGTCTLKCHGYVHTGTAY
jgi:hypothetical protein